VLKTQSTVQCLLLLLISLATACSDPQHPPTVVEIAESSPSPVRNVSPATNTPTQLMALTDVPAATDEFPTKPPITIAPVQAKRSDFIVTIAPPTVSTTISISSPSTAANLLTTPEAAGVACEYKATFVSDVSIPDDTAVEPGASLVKTWRFRNSGTCDWDSGIAFSFVSGDQMSAPDSVTISTTPSLSTVDVSVPLTAPLSSGIYTGHWQLQTLDQQAIGEQVFVRISVTSPLPVAPEQEPRSVIGARSVPPLVLLNYFAWYDADGWDDCNISAGDRPLNPYHSDDPAAIGQHIRLALNAGADGFTLQWFAPSDRTDRNFAALLNQSEGTGFRSTIVFLRHIWHGSPAASQVSVAEAIRYVLDRYSSHPNFLTLDGKPVLFFADVYRVPSAAGQSAQQAWAAIREQVDPGGNAWWIGEGLDPSYLAVFDGLWVYKITHAVSPQAYSKASQWADAVRAWEARTGQQKLWIATLSPGWDDTRADCRADVRVPSAAHRQERGDGAFFRATFDAAMGSAPEWLWVNSFNEWVEGTYIEPSVLYGDRYLELLRQYSTAFKER